MKNVILAVSLVLAFTLSACSDEDGDWDSMKWNTSVVKEKDGKIAVPSQGGSYVFICTNYNKPWMSDLTVKTDGKEETHYHPDDRVDIITSPELTAEWNGNTLTVTVAPNETGKERQMALHVTAGDIFDTFIFKQVAAQ